MKDYNWFISIRLVFLASVQNGYLSALPYLIMWILIVAFSCVSDYINTRGLMSKTVQRKMWNTVAHWGGALALLLLYLFDTTVTEAIILLTVALGLNSGVFTGFLTNHIDLAPNFAGPLMGLTNSIASLTSILGPLLVGFMVTDSVSDVKNNSRSPFPRSSLPTVLGSAQLYFKQISPPPNIPRFLSEVFVVVFCKIILTQT